MVFDNAVGNRQTESRPGDTINFLIFCSEEWVKNPAQVIFGDALTSIFYCRRVVLTGGPSELELETGQEIESAMHNDVLNLIGKDTINQSVALLQRATVVLSPDSGPAHIASAIGTPVLGLYAATPSRRSGPYNSLDLCVDKYTEVARQFKHKKPEELRWGQRIEFPGVMDLIKTQEVTAKLDVFMQHSFSYSEL